MSITRGVVAQFTREKLANLRIKFLPSTYRRREKRSGWQQVYRREIKEYKIVYMDSGLTRNPQVCCEDIDENQVLEHHHCEILDDYENRNICI
jgi:hypothetical protein